MAGNYQKKLKDPRWQKKRLEVLNRDDFKCTICEDKNETLHVHHKSYNGDPWDVDISELTTLCETCHSIIHKWEVELYQPFHAPIDEIPDRHIRRQFGIKNNTGEKLIVSVEIYRAYIYSINSFIEIPNYEIGVIDELMIKL